MHAIQYYRKKLKLTTRITRIFPTFSGEYEFRPHSDVTKTDLLQTPQVFFKNEFVTVNKTATCVQQSARTDYTNRAAINVEKWKLYPNEIKWK